MKFMKFSTRAKYLSRTIKRKLTTSLVVTLATNHNFLKISNQNLIVSVKSEKEPKYTENAYLDVSFFQI